MQAIKLFFYAVIAAAVAYTIYRIAKLGEDFTTAAGKTYDNAKDTVRNYVSPDGQSPLANKFSEWFGGLFRSPAEKEVDAQYGLQVFRPKGKPVNVPSENLSPLGFNNPDNYTTIPSLVNAPPGFDPTLPPTRACDKAGNCGDYERAQGPADGVTFPGSNSAPENNNTEFMF